MPFELASELEQRRFIKWLTQTVVADQQTTRDGGRTATQASGEWDAVRTVQPKARVGRAGVVKDGSSCPEYQIFRAIKCRASRNHLDLVPQIESKAEAVEARTHIGARRGRAHDDDLVLIVHPHLELVRREGCRPRQL